MKIKPLEWSEVYTSTDLNDEYAEICYSYGGIVEYQVHRVQGGSVWFANTPASDARHDAYYGQFATMEEAQAVCQADHERTVMSYFEDSPDDRQA